MRPLPLLPALLLAMALPAWSGDLVLIANPANPVERLSHAEAVNIFMGRLRMFAGGQTAQPLDLPAEAPEKAQFYRLLLGKELADIDSYWARLLFSGATKPPKIAASQEQVLELVARDRRAIGYVERAKADKRVRVVMELGH